MCDKFFCTMSHLELTDSGVSALYCQQHDIFIYDSEICNYCLLISCDVCRMSGGRVCENVGERVVTVLSSETVKSL